MRLPAVGGEWTGAECWPAELGLDEYGQQEAVVEFTEGGSQN
jgi:hypothetical protein